MRLIKKPGSAPIVMQSEIQRREGIYREPVIRCGREKLSVAAYFIRMTLCNAIGAAAAGFQDRTTVVAFGS
jgi:hypothetical protein